MNKIYLDYAAATPVDERVLTVMEPYFTTNFYNPSATYLAAREVRHAIEAAREQTAKSLGIRPTEVIFTAGGTEANNLAIHGVMAMYPKANMVTTAIEHKSVLMPAQTHKSTIVPVLPDGQVDLQELKKAITDSTVLVSIGYVNNEIGTIQPMNDIVEVLNGIRNDRSDRNIKLPLYLHTDACQAVNYLNVSPHSLGVDLMTINGGKIYGPKQSGMLYVKAGLELQPLITGGGQERHMRSGTENVPAIIGFAAALERAVKRHSGESKRLTELREAFIGQLLGQASGATVNGSRKHRIANNIHITIPGTDNERLMMELDERGIQCAVGSACNASDDEPSHVLKAIGLSDTEAQSSLRFTLGKTTTSDDIDAVTEVLSGLLNV